MIFGDEDIKVNLTISTLILYPRILGYLSKSMNNTNPESIPRVEYINFFLFSGTIANKSCQRLMYRRREQTIPKNITSFLGPRDSGESGDVDFLTGIPNRDEMKFLSSM